MRRCENWEFSLLTARAWMRSLSKSLFLVLLMLSVSTLTACKRNEEAATPPVDPILLSPDTSNSEALVSRPVHDQKQLEKLLSRGGFLSRFQQWEGTLMITRVMDQPSLEGDRAYSLNAVYQDTNQNQVPDQGDAGFFNPASTVKVGIAIMALEKLNNLNFPRDTEYQLGGSGPWFNIADDIQKAMVISDNESTNRLIQFIGFTPLNRGLRARGIESFAVNRLMLDRGTLVESPPIQLRYQSQNRALEPTVVEGSYPCQEKTNTLGNCATAQDLTQIWLRLIHPQKFLPKQRFDLRPSDRVWLQNVLSKTPKQVGFDQYTDDYCRFLHSIELSLIQPQGQLLSKCGVALFSRTYVDTSYIETNFDQQFVSVLAVSPPASVEEPEIFAWMSQVIEYVLPQLNSDTQSGD